MKVVIVGCGWLGLQLATALHYAGHQVFASRRSMKGLAQLPQGVNPLLLDLSAVTATTEIISAMHNAMVVCAIPPALRSGGAHYGAALTQLAQLMQNAGSLGVVHFSSSGIYQGLTADVDETVALRHDIDRVTTLAQGEAILQQALPLCITLRLAGLMGPGRHPGRFVAGKTLPSPDGLINMLHADDACRAVLRLLSCNELHSATYNLSCPLPVARRQFYQAASKALQTAVSFSDDLVISHRSVPLLFIQHFAFKYRFENAIDALSYCD